MPSTPRFWVNDDADGMWNNGNNWSDSSGGTGGLGVPTSGQTAVFDGACTDTCRMNAAAACTGISVYDTFTGTLDANTDSLNHAISGNVSFQGGTIDMGSGTWTVTGGFEITASVSAFNHNGGIVECANLDVHASFKFGTIYISSSGTIDSDIEVDGHIEVASGGAWNGGSYDVYMGDGAYISVDASGSFTADVIYATTGTIMGTVDADVEYKVNGDGTAYLGVGFTCNNLRLEQLGASGTYSVDGSLNGDIYTILGNLVTVTAGGNLELHTGNNSFRVAGNVDLSGLSTFNPGSGEFALVGGAAGPYTVTLQSAVATSFNILRIEDCTRTFGADTFVVGTLNHNGGTLDLHTNDPDTIWTTNCNMAAAATANLGGGTFTVSGSLSIENGAAITATSTPLVLSGASSGTQTIGIPGITFGQITVDDAGATKQFTSAVNAGDIYLTAGTLDFNGQTVNCDSGYGNGDFVTTAGSQMVGTGMNGCSLTVTGDLDVNGSAGVVVDWAAGSAWTLTVYGATATADYVDVAYCDASGGLQITQTNCTDSGNNTNWSFASGPTARTWSAAGDGLWSNAANWTPNGVPGTDPGDTVVFDGTSGANCRMDSAVTIAGITMAVGFTGTLNAATDNLSHSVGSLGVYAGTLSMGSGTWTIGEGGMNIDAAATFNHNSGTILMSEADGSTACLGGGKTLNNLTIAASLASALLAGNFTIAGTMSIGADSAVSLTSTNHITINGILTVAAGGSLTSASTAKVTLASGASISGTTGTINPYLLDVYGNKSAAQFPARTYGAVKFNNASDVTVTYAAGTYNFTDLTYSNTTADLLFIDAATNDPTINVSGNWTTVNSGGGTLRIDMGDGTWTVAGNIDLAAVTTLNCNASTLVLSGSSGSQTIGLAGKTFNVIQVNASGATKVISAAGFTCATLTMTAGTIDCATNNPNLTVSGAATLGGATLSMGSGTKTFGSFSATTGAITEGGGTKNIGGNLTIAAAVTVTRNASSNWNLTASGNLTVGALAAAVTKITQANGITTTLVGTVALNGAQGLVTGNATSTIQDNGSAVNLNMYSTSNITHNGATFTSTALDRLQIGYYNAAHSIGGNFGQCKIVLNAPSSTVTMTAAVTCGSVDLSNGTLDASASNFALNASGNFISAAGGTLNMRAATWTVTGNWDTSLITSITATSATLVMNGTGKTLNGFLTYANRLGNLTISGSITTGGTIQTSILGTLTISGTFTVNHNCCSIEWSNNTHVTGTLNGSGTLQIQNLATFSGTISIATLNVVSPSTALPAGTYGCTTVYFSRNSAGTSTFGAGTFNFSGHLYLRNTSAGTGVIAGVTNNPTINITGNLTTANTGGGTLDISLGSGTWTVGGIVDLSAAANMACNTSTLVMTGASKTLKGINGWNTRLYNLTIQGTVSLASSLTASGTTRIEGTFTVSSYVYSATLGTVRVVGAGASITGTGTFACDRSNLVQQDGTINCTTFQFGSNSTPSTLLPATYDATNFQIMVGTGMFVPSAGTYIIKGSFNKADWTSGVTIDNSVNNPNWEFWGDVRFYNANGASNYYTWTRGTGTITLKGTTGTQVFCPYNQTLGDVVLNCAGATKQMSAICTPTLKSLTFTAGTLDASTNNPATITIENNTTSAAGTLSMGSGTWTVGGNLNWQALTLTANTSTLIMSGTAKTLNAQNKSLNNLTASGTIQVTDSMTVAGALSVTNSLSIDSGRQISVTGSVSNTGTLTGAGTLIANSTIPTQSGTLNVALLRMRGTSMAAATYGSANVNLERISTGSNTLVLGAGTFNFSGNVLIQNTDAGSQTVNGNTNSPTVNVTGNVTTVNSGGGTLTWNRGSGVWTVAGNFDVAAVTTYTSIGTTVLSGAGKTLTSTQNQDFNNLTISGTITQSGSLDVNGILRITGTYTLNSGATYRMLDGSNLKIEATGTLTGTGTLGINASSQVSQQDGTISLTAIDCSNITGALVPATYGCTTFTFAGVGTSVFTFSAGTYGFVNLQIRATGGSNTVDASVNNPTINVSGNLTSTLPGGATTLLMGSGTWTVRGNVDLSLVTTLTPGTSTLALAGAGAGTQTINIGGKTLNALTVNDAGATKRWTATGWTAATFTLTAGTVDGATNNPSNTCTGDFTVSTGATYNRGTGTLTINGNVSLSSGCTWTTTTGTMLLAGSTGTQTIDLGGKTLAVIQVHGSGSTKRLAATGFTSSALTLTAGTLDAATNNPSPTVTGALSVAAAGIFTMGTGTWTVGGSVSIAAGSTTTATGATLTLAGAGTGNQDVNLGAKTFSAVTVNDAGATKRFAGTFTVTTFTATAGAIDNTPGDPSFTVKGNLSVGAGVTYAAGDGAITLTGAGAGTQTLTLNGQTIEDVVVDDPGATKQLLSNLSCSGLSVVDGTFDPNGYDVATTNDLLIESPGAMDDPVGSAFTVGGDCFLYGESAANKLDLDASGAWELNVTGSALASYVSVTDSDASGGTTVNATGSDDNGGNVNWDFNVPVPPIGSWWHSGRRPLPQLYLHTGGLW